MNTPPDIIIAGAGPVGLTAAALLARRGLTAVVVEERDALDMEPKASTFHAPTLELLDWLDVAQPLISKGLIADRYQNRDRSRGVIADFDFAALKDDTPYPYRLQCEQQRLSELLLEQLADSESVEVHYGTKLTSFDANENGVTATVTTAGGEHRIEGRYLLGTDGASSTVREELEVEFPGTTYVDRYLVFLTDFPFEDHLEDLCLVNYISDPEEFVVLLRAPEAWRVLFRADESMTEEEAYDPELAQRRLNGVVPRDEPYRILHTQLYRIHQRVAEGFRWGRVLLLGDAAHINSPIGGMGMNNGIHDAFDLARTLPGVLRGELPDADLDDWAVRRESIAREYVQIITDRNAKALGERDESTRRAHQQELAEIANDPARSREWLLSSSMIKAVREQSLLPYR